MSIYLRPRIPGATIFFTLCLAERGASLLTDEIDRLRAACRQTMQSRPFRIEAMVVLPDHLHAVWTLPEGDANYSARWGAIKARFSRELPAGRLRASHIARREKGIWQRRFWEHHLRSDAARLAAIRYCWANPVKHGLVAAPQDWPYSSIHRDMRSGAKK